MACETFGKLFTRSEDCTEVQRQSRGTRGCEHFAVEHHALELAEAGCNF